MRFFTAFLLVCFCGIALRADDSLKAALDAQLLKNEARYGIVGQSVMLLKNGEPLYRGKAGLAHLELDVPVAENHLFPSYSVAKLFTSVLVMQIVEEGKIDTGASIRTYLPTLTERWQPITVAHVLNHTSGIPRYIDDAITRNKFLPSKAAVFEAFADAPEHFKIGTRNGYNNTNYLVLAAILEAVSGESFEALVNARIITPLGLKHTGHASAKAVVKNMVSSYQGADGTVRKNIDVDWPIYTFSHSALYSTPEDLTKFMTALTGGKLVPLNALKNFWQPMALADGSKGHYAFGFEYAERDGYIQVGHDGGNRVKLRHYFPINGEGDSYTLAYLTNGYAHGVWTDIFADSVMARVNEGQFARAHITEAFMAHMLEHADASTAELYGGILKAVGSAAAAESFITNRAYAVRYAAGQKAAIPAFKMLTDHFPNSANAWSHHAEQWEHLGDTAKAISYYRKALELNPEHSYAKRRLVILVE